LPQQVAQLNASLNALAAVLNAVSGHYLKSETRFDMFARHAGAIKLLYLMDEGVRAFDEREERIQSGNPKEEDFAIRSI
jgi:hypothetical protein